MVGLVFVDFFMLCLGMLYLLWIFIDDSNMFGIGDCDGVMSVMFELDCNQVVWIRGLG